MTSAPWLAIAPGIAITLAVTSERRRDRRRRDRRLGGLASGEERARGRAGRDGACRRRAVEPQLGLVPPAGPRTCRNPSCPRGAAAVGRHAERPLRRCRL